MMVEIAPTVILYLCHMPVSMVMLKSCLGYRLIVWYTGERMEERCGLA